jgi:thiamine pyrophosphate-dependent acetolactate synthase large subunit-like protein
VRIEAAKQLRPALEDALRAQRSVLIDCPVDYRENDRLLESRPAAREGFDPRLRSSRSCV